jgi:hypothetical protein
MRTIVLGAVLSAVSVQAGATPPAALAEAVAATGGVKTGIAEYALTWGKWPAAADPDVVGAPKSYAGANVARLDLYAGAVVEVTLNAAAGGGHIRVRPANPDPSHQPIAWLCESPDVPDIDRLPGCNRAAMAFGPEVLAIAAGLKTAIAEHRMNYAAWPAAADPQIVESPTRYAGTHVARIDLAAHGVLRVTLQPSAGGGHLVLTPDAPGSSIVWTCTSPDIVKVASAVDDCTYAPHLR